MEWRSVVGYEGLYEVSDEGQIQRIGRGRGVKRGGRVRKQSDHKQGYKAITLYSDNQARGFLVHRIIAAAFLGPCPDGREVNHKDGNKKHNAAVNLEYLTRIDNMAHAVTGGALNNFGENNPMAKLTGEQVAEIRRDYSFGGYRVGGLGYKALGKKYGVCWGAIRNIIKGRVWQTV
ncbi:MAG: NUMOD4 motif-containing HNH endonuclease [Dehalococcoidia bacterium]|nr:NUMOD4 motif-containing HNH endonuclease [Dehalococcoidia bacterium]